MQDVRHFSPFPNGGMILIPRYGRTARPKARLHAKADRCLAVNHGTLALNGWDLDVSPPWITTRQAPGLSSTGNATSNEQREHSDT